MKHLIASISLLGLMACGHRGGDFLHSDILQPAAASSSPSTSADTKSASPDPTESSTSSSLTAPSLSAQISAALEPSDAHSVSEVRAANLTATVVGVSGPRGVSLEFVTPAGDLYQRSTETLFGTPAETQVVSFKLPVAGTHIDQSQLTGTWGVRLVMGNQILATSQFELQP